MLDFFRPKQRAKVVIVPPHSVTCYRFGNFQVDLLRREVLKYGTRIKIQDKPFRLLAILLEQPGETVARDELQRRLWPADTFVGFEDGLNVAANKLRLALGDNAENPRFLETVPRRGYRFIAPVTIVEESESSEAQISGVAVLTAASEAPANHRAASIAPQPEPRKARRKRQIFIYAVGFGALACSAGIYFHLRHPARLTDKDTIVLADFSNTTGDPVFDVTLRQGMAIQLEQSPFLSLMSEERIQQVLKLMGRQANEPLTPEVAQEICVRTASAAVLQGSIAPLGTQYVLGLRAKNCRTGAVLAQVQVQAARKEGVLHALDQIASSFRNRVGESLSTTQKHSTPLAEATTSSLDALKAYSYGTKVESTIGEAESLPFFQRAIEIDPQFAMAYAHLGLMYGATGESNLSAENTGKAYALRNRASDPERFFIAASYDSRVTGNLEKAQQTCETWAQTYPRETAPHAYLSGFIYPASAKYQKSVEEAQKMIDIDPDFPFAYSILGYSYAALGQVEQARAALQLASARNPQLPGYFIVERYDFALLQNDRAGMGREVALAQGNPETESWILYHQAFALANAGHMHEATGEFSRSEALALQSSHKERAALFTAGEAICEALLGNARAARGRASAALALSNDREVEYGAAFALVLSGDTARAQTLSNDMERRFAEDTAVRFSYLPSLRAMLSLNHGDSARAIKMLELAVPYELGTERSTIHGSFGALYPVYARGEAYLAAHRGPEAAGEFRRIRDHSEIVAADPIGALAYLQSGRAFALSGDKAKAKIAYQDFLAHWKDADPDIPIYQQAKAEYAKL